MSSYYSAIPSLELCVDISNRLILCSPYQQILPSTVQQDLIGALCLITMFSSCFSYLSDMIHTWSHYYTNKWMISHESTAVSELRNTVSVTAIIQMGCGVLREWGNECGNRIRDRTRKGQGQSYARVWEVRRECWRCRVESMECGGWVMENGSIGVRTWLQLICCTLAEEQGCP